MTNPQPTPQENSTFTDEFCDVPEIIPAPNTASEYLPTDGEPPWNDGATTPGDTEAEPEQSPPESFLRAIAGPTGAFSFAMPEPDAPDEIFRWRYLTRGNAMQISAQTGVGKSVFANQGAILWANGLSFLGFAPCRPLKILVLQAENDDGEEAIINNGIAEGLELTPSQIETANSNAIFVRYDGGLSDAEMVQLWDYLAEEHKPDLFILDPFFAFHTGDLSPKDISRFYRQQVSPTLRNHNMAGLIIHHWNKPPAVKVGTSNRPITDHAYDGAGAAEQANFCRAVVSISGTATPGLFEILYGKRGGRLLRRPKYIRQNRDQARPCWFEVPDEELVNNELSQAGESIVGKLLAKIKTGDRVRKRDVERDYGKLFGCSRADISNAIELSLVKKYFRIEREKVQGGSAVYLVREPLNKEAEHAEE